ncbi:MAG: family 78 glycoside hydrolase catalytic domain, partial [Clostridia bacterium]|nr:family 78 glycoside hydrolase catalytic domain [Clostridia bacterium]
PFIRRIQSFAPKKITKNGESFIVESPEMTTGWAAIRISLPEGERVTVTYAETLDTQGFAAKIGKGEGRDGNWWPDAYIQQDTFISGGEETVFEPKFSYKGFKFIQLDGIENLTADDIVIHKIANSVEIISEFECSDELLNQLHALMRRTLLNNFQGKPTDTPVWEKNGWLGDVNCALETMMYNFDMNGFMQSFVDTMADCLHEYGKVPVIVPTVDWGIDNSPVWNTVFVFAPLSLYDRFGNKAYLDKIYPDLRRFALYNATELRAIGNTWGTRGLSDWVAPSGDENGATINDPSEGAEICCTAYVYAMLKAMVRIAEILGKPDHAQEYEAAAKEICDAFNGEFYNAEKGIYETSVWNQKGNRERYRQTSNLLPLAFGMVAEENKERVLKNLADNFVSRGYRLDTGCTGTKYVLPILFENGCSDIASRVMLQTAYPSWGYWIANGHGSAWESWEKATRSLNHYFLGTYDEAYFGYLAGIREIRNGYETFTVAPILDCTLDWVRAKIKTPRGIAACEWKKVNGTCTVNITVPEGATARVNLIFGEKKISETVTGGEYEYIL